MYRIPYTIERINEKSGEGIDDDKEAAKKRYSDLRKHTVKIILDDLYD